VCKKFDNYKNKNSEYQAAVCMNCNEFQDVKIGELYKCVHCGYDIVATVEQGIDFIAESDVYFSELDIDGE